MHRNHPTFAIAAAISPCLSIDRMSGAVGTELSHDVGGGAPSAPDRSLLRVCWGTVCNNRRGPRAEERPGAAVAAAAGPSASSDGRSGSRHRDAVVRKYLSGVPASGTDRRHNRHSGGRLYRCRCTEQSSHPRHGTHYISPDLLGSRSTGNAQDRHATSGIEGRATARPTHWAGPPSPPTGRRRRHTRWPQAVRFDRAPGGNSWTGVITC